VVDEQPTEQQPGGRPDETAKIPAADETAVQPRAADETAVQRPAEDSTAILPPAEEAPRWSARAGVAPRRPAAQQEQEWVPESPPPSGTWWTPLLIGFAVLILVGLIALGLWLAMRGSGPAPQVSTPPSVVPTSASPTPSPTPSTSSAPAALVPVPVLTNVPVSDALPILQGQGLVPKVVNQVNDAVPAGTVIGTDPAAGTQVPTGTVITVFVATPSPTSASPSPSPSSPSPSPSHTP
jgi:hypothetical protein